MKLHSIYINYTTQNQGFSGEIPLSYEVFGPPLGTAPVVLVNHALTGNSSVCGAHGWWNQLIGNGKCIDTQKYSVLAFNIPGNGYDGFEVTTPEGFSVYDISKLFLLGIQKLNIKQIYAGIGGSLGGSIIWQMAVLSPKLFDTIIPVATDWKSTDWVLANCRIQKQILEHSSDPLSDARIHAMTLYRAPKSLTEKFHRSIHNVQQIPNVECWLLHHGETLKRRFKLKSYTLMNHLLTTINITKDTGDFLTSVRMIQGNILLIGVDSDLFFTNAEIVETYHAFKSIKKNIQNKTITSIHGHDAFLIEFDQLAAILKPVFQFNNQNNEYNRTKENTDSGCFVN